MTPTSSSCNPVERPRTSTVIAVVDSLRDWPESWAGRPVYRAIDYLSGTPLAKGRLRVINLCSHNSPLSKGYYVSLLAEARGHRVIPSAALLHKLERRRSYRDELEDFDAILQSSLRRIESDSFTLSVYFGENLAATHQNLARRLYNEYPCPLMVFNFRRDKHRWYIHHMRQLGLQEIPSAHHEFVRDQLDRVLRMQWRNRSSSNKAWLSMGILYNPKEKFPPSNPAAIRRFIRAAQGLGINAECIGAADYPRLLEFDFLFIRETTRLDNHTMRFASRAEREGLVVIDPPDSIRRCCNKVFLEELLKNNGVPTPPTRLLLRNHVKQLAGETEYPCVLKIPESSFSMGVFKINNPDELTARAAELFKLSDIIVHQAFTPTRFDWRIGVLDGIPLYACRYYMSQGHWQIYNHAAHRKSDREGNFDCVAVADVPPQILKHALRACQLVGPGLHGVDLKETDDGRIYIIEVNDNPNIDAGIEDSLAGEALYQRIMRYFIDQLERRRTPVPAETPGT